MDRRERQHLIERLRADARRIASHFGLEYKAIEAESLRVKARYGVCYEDGLIKIRLHNVRTGRALKYSSLVDTLCHELAHLVHFNHGPEFKAYFLELLGWARQQGIYQPDLRRARRFSRQSALQRLAAQQAPLPETRNGVPVFGEHGPINAQNLWERLAQRAGDAALAAAPAPRPASRPAPRPRTTPRREPVAARPRPRPQVQFPLFAERSEATATPAPSTSRRRAPGSSAAPSPTPRKQQLALFE
ncbi:MAG: DUF45 domain-containing protein [Myxococcales bacterium]|nr:DUF45 domain-containing protein [Myxococcales bacterium]